MLRKMFVIPSLTALLLACAGAPAYAADAPTKDEQSRKEAQLKLDAAHERLEQAAREVAELSTRMATDRMPDSIMFLGRNPNRAMLGIAMGEQSDKDAGDGVRVVSVSPGGPAAGAGIKAGDVVVELNGKSLKRDKDTNPDEKLLSEMTKLSPGDDVSLSYRRDGKLAVVKLKAEKLPPRTYAGPMHFEQRIIHGDHSPFDEEQEFEFARVLGSMHMGPFGGIELVPLSPKLGQYFGAEKGLLMARVPQDKELKLEDGDVLIDIDGRVPSNPGHAFRILGSYQPGEKVTLNILRQRKKMAVAITVPEHEQHGPRPPMPPMPPHPPRAAQPASAPVAPVPPTSATQPIT